ncbi:MAG: OmpA family protein [Cytophagales bacterium]|nr:OmpA family protein [Cytophagales bacterium]
MKFIKYSIFIIFLAFTKGFCQNSVKNWEQFPSTWQPAWKEHSCNGPVFYANYTQRNFSFNTLHQSYRFGTMIPLYQNKYGSQLFMRAAATNEKIRQNHVPWKNTEIHGDLAYSFFLNRRSQLSFSTGIIHHTERMDLENLSTDSQWKQHFGHMKNLPNGENFSTLKDQVVSIKAGALYKRFGDSPESGYFAGVSFMHINQPCLTFVSEKNPIPLAWSFQTGISTPLSALYSFNAGIFGMSSKQTEEYFAKTGVRRKLPQGYVGVALGGGYPANVTPMAEIRAGGLTLMASFEKSLADKNLNHSAFSLAAVLCLNREKPSAYKIGKTTKIKRTASRPSRSFRNIRKKDLARRKLIEKKLQQEDAKQQQKTLAFRFLTHYKLNEYKLSEQNIEYLGQVLAKAKQYRKFTLLIEGHSDQTGSDRAKNRVSKKRAVRVKRFFTRNGIESKVIETKHYGDRQPLENYPKEAAQNRRVEILLVVKD